MRIEGGLSAWPYRYCLKRTRCSFPYMSSFADQPNAADARRAAALIIHGRRGDSDGIEALLAEADSAGRITELVLAVLDLYRHVIGELRSDNGTGLIAAYVAQTCQLAKEAGPDTG